MIDAETRPRSLIAISGCSGAGLPPLSTHLTLASAHCETPNDAITPSSEPRTASGLGAKLSVTSLVSPGLTDALGGSIEKPRRLASSLRP